MKSGEVKIRYRLPDPRYLPGRVTRKKPRPGYCQKCGAKLTDPKSLKVGYGHQCIKGIPILLILEIPGE